MLHNASENKTENGWWKGRVRSNLGPEIKMIFSATPRAESDVVLPAVRFHYAGGRALNVVAHEMACSWTGFKLDKFEGSYKVCFIKLVSAWLDRNTKIGAVKWHHFVVVECVVFHLNEIGGRRLKTMGDFENHVLPITILNAYWL